MKVKFLGTAGYFPTEYRNTNCVMLPEEGIVFDAGTAFFRVKDNVETKKLDILLSHYHPDHIDGLTFMLGLFKKSNLNVNIYGPGGIENLEEKLHFNIKLKFKDYPTKAGFKVNLKKIKKRFRLGNVVIKTKLFPHSLEVSAGYRVEKKDKVLCYLTDLVASDEEIDFIKDANLLIHECYFDKSKKEDAKESFHSYTAQVAGIAKKANVKCLALYHVDPLAKEAEVQNYVKECREIFQNTILPSDKMEVII